MNRFARLFEALDATTSSGEKADAIGAMLAEGADEEASWILHALLGRTIARTVTPRTIARWVRDAAGLPDWLFRECYVATGDLAEAVALVIDASGLARGGGGDASLPVHRWIRERLEPLALLDPAEQRAHVLRYLGELPRTERFLLMKLLTGAMRAGVAKGMVVRALARHASLDEELIAQRLAGAWSPGPDAMAHLLAPADAPDRTPRPAPFFLASPVEEHPGAPDALGPISDWLLEWKWDGIRAQLLRSAGELSLWSRGDELLTERFPEIADAAARLPASVTLDGEIVAWRDGRPLPFSVLQRRIGRRALSRGVLRDAPAAFLAFDVLRVGTDDLRERPLSDRRALLEQVVARAAHPRLLLSEVVSPATWDDARTLRAASRERGVEGLVLKRRSSRYSAGRVRGDWWKWKIAPRTFDAVLLYAEPGHGRRAGLLTDYTFGVWDRGVLVPVAKAYSGLTDAEIAELDRWLRAHTLESFGPARRVEPTRVFEIAFEGIARSPRHRGGIAFRFPRMLRQRPDKRPHDAATIESLLALLPPAPREETLFG
ncbi:MAG: ATP-dependent DNA ligase [Planctomycetota bacterium]|nr:ATP-dependent DNA ligase [Planctomycetota bacterium]